MNLGLRQIDWQYIGALLARSSDVEQTDFFKAFVKECKSWGTEYQIEFQLVGINKKLTKEEKEALSMLSYEG